jgi:hypothetical protein
LPIKKASPVASRGACRHAEAPTTPDYQNASGFRQLNKMIRRLSASLLKGISIAGIPLVMAACASYHDPRPLEEQQAALSSAKGLLLGTYEVIEGRPKAYGGYDKVTVRQAGNAFVVFLQGPKGFESWDMRATTCRGYDAANHKFVDVMCEPRGGNVNFFSIGRNESGQSIKDGAMIPSYQPMTVAGDEYLLHVGMHGGRSYYYRLKKQP